MFRCMKIAAVSAVLATSFGASAPAVATELPDTPSYGRWMVTPGASGTASWINGPRPLAIMGMANASEPDVDPVG